LKYDRGIELANEEEKKRQRKVNIWREKKYCRFRCI